MTEKIFTTPPLHKPIKVESINTYNGPFQKKVFSKVQQIRIKPNEDYRDLHERLRPYIRNSFLLINKPTKVKTHSWYTFDASSLLGKDIFVLSTSTCKHETPIKLLVGKRLPNFQQKLEDGTFEYTMFPVDITLTDAQKDEIYNRM